MKIVNLMPHDLTIFRAEDTKPAGPKGYVLAHDSIPLVRIPSSGISRAAAVENPVGTVNGIPLFRMAFGEPVGVPDPAPDTVYVVSSITAQACREAGRDTDDLLIPARTVRDANGRIIGCTAFSCL